MATFNVTQLVFIVTGTLHIEKVTIVTFKSNPVPGSFFNVTSYYLK